MSEVETSEVGGAVRAWAKAQFEEILPTDLRPDDLGQRVEALAELVCGDLHACTFKDKEPEDREEPERYVFETSLSFGAISRHRLAHSLIELRDELGEALAVADRERLVFEAKKLSEAAKLSCGVEIHPEAEIGARLRIDHGLATLIGQQVRIGCDCTLLQGVVLGAPRMDAEDLPPDSDRRHPTIGDGVQIYGMCCVYGPVTVGDGAILGPKCSISSDVPAGGKVAIVNQLQVTRPPGGDGPRLEGLRWAGGNRLDVIGKKLTGVVPAFVDSTHREIEEVECAVVNQADEYLLLAVSVREPGVEIPEPPRLQLRADEGEVILLEATGLRELWENCGEIVRPTAPTH